MIQRMTAAATFLFFAACAAPAPGSEADRILEMSGVRGGLIVHVGCGDGRLTAALHRNDRYLVHGLDRDPAKVREARKHFLSLGLCGEVSADVYDGEHLPYGDNLVNLLVASGPGDAPRLEVMRVLAPGGTAIIGERRIRKPWPAEIDQWTHFLHDASGNAVAKDDRVGSPRRIQWTAGPKRTRDHDALASWSAMTSSNGRLFYILDEGPTSLIHRPARWKLVARDAFNGVLLWKRDIPMWLTHLYYFRSGPVQLPRRLVSVGDRVYVTLGLDAPITALDAATGETLFTFAGSERTEELIRQGDLLLAVIGDPDILKDEAPRVYGYWQLSVERKPTIQKSIVAYDADTGKAVWRKAGSNLKGLVPLSLTACGDRVFYLDQQDLHCADLSTGRSLWKAPFPTEGLFLRNYAPTVVAYEDVILCLTWNRLCAFAVADGRKLWERKGSMGFASPADLFAIDGLAWTIPLTSAIWRGNKLRPDGKIATGVPIPTENFLGDGGKEIWGIDVHTGEVKKSLVRSDVLPGGHHHRCYRNKATEHYLICSRRGLEFVDTVDGDFVNNWWVRGVCQYGVMPANGLIYVPPDPCQCFNLIKVNGLLALSSSNSLDTAPPPPRRGSLEKGPAYDASLGSGRSRAGEAESTGGDADRAGVRAWRPPAYQSPDEWPTYRGNITRSGSTTSHVSAQVGPVWRARIGENLSAPVIADGRLFVSSKDAGVIHCVDAATGRVLWRFVAGGRVDSPPTIDQGRCLFGGGDGSVYCLRASDGQLIWRFRASPVDRRVVADNRLESIWPIDGSVLVRDGVVYFAAGRSSYLDGGIRLYGLDAASGRPLYHALVAAEPIRPGKPAPREKMTGALPDVLIADGDRINMRQVQFEKDLTQLDKAEIKTLLATTGLLEDLWAHRQNWCLGFPGRIDSHAHPGGIGTQRESAAAPMGKLIVFDDQHAYCVVNPYSWLKYTPSLYPPTHEGHLHQKYSRYQAANFPIGVKIYACKNQSPSAAGGRRRGKRAGPVGPSALTADWMLDSRLQPRAMVLTPDAIFLAGWLDSLAIRPKTGQALDPADPDPRPAVLQVLAPADGATVAQRPLPSEPVFDGMAAAGGRLFLCLRDGSVLCLGSP